MVPNLAKSGVAERMVYEGERFKLISTLDAVTVERLCSYLLQDVRQAQRRMHGEDERRRLYEPEIVFKIYVCRIESFQTERRRSRTLRIVLVDEGGWREGLGGSEPSCGVASSRSTLFIHQRAYKNWSATYRKHFC
jgi:hypothetical protein